jgi:hypothetical protein
LSCTNLAALSLSICCSLLSDKSIGASLGVRGELQRAKKGSKVWAI